MWLEAPACPLCPKNVRGRASHGGGTDTRAGCVVSLAAPEGEEGEDESEEEGGPGPPQDDEEEEGGEPILECAHMSSRVRIVQHVLIP